MENKNSEIAIKINITVCSDKCKNNSICVQNLIITALLEHAFNLYQLKGMPISCQIQCFRDEREDAVSYTCRHRHL